MLFRSAISIAVLHHISSEEKRKCFVLNIIKCLRKGGKALIVVWAKEQDIKHTWKQINGNDYLIPWHGNDHIIYERYYHLFSKEEVIDLFACFSRSIKVHDIQYELDNWCIVLSKK